MKKIGIIGGTFDPVHYGHLILAEQALGEAGLDQVIFMPVMVQPFKINLKAASANHRYEMLLLAVDGNPRFEVSKIELDTKEVCYTINTLRECRARFGQDTAIYFIMGTDAFLSIDKWYKADSLLKEFAFIIGTRPGYKEQELKAMLNDIRQTYNTKIIQINNSEVEISSTNIKDRIKEGKSIKYLLPKEVEDYIYKHGLYRD